MRTMTGYLTTLILAFLLLGSAIGVLSSTGTNNVEAQVILPEIHIEVDPGIIIVKLPPGGTGNCCTNVTVTNQEYHTITVEITIEIPGYSASPNSYRVTLKPGDANITRVDFTALIDIPYSVHGRVLGEVLVVGSPYHAPIITEVGFMIQTSPVYVIELSGIYDLTGRSDLTDASDIEKNDGTDTVDIASKWKQYDIWDLTNITDLSDSGDAMVMGPGKEYLLGFAVTNLGNRNDHLSMDVTNMNELRHLGFSLNLTTSTIYLRPRQTGIIIVQIRTPDHHMMDRQVPIEIMVYSADSDAFPIIHSLGIMVKGEEPDENVLSILQVILIALGAFLFTRRRS